MKSQETYVDCVQYASCYLYKIKMYVIFDIIFIVYSLVYIYSAYISKKTFAYHLYLLANVT